MTEGIIKKPSLSRYAEGKTQEEIKKLVWNSNKLNS